MDTSQALLGPSALQGFPSIPGEAKVCCPGAQCRELALHPPCSPSSPCRVLNFPIPRPLQPRLPLSFTFLTNPSSTSNSISFFLKNNFSWHFVILGFFSWIFFLSFSLKWVILCVTCSTVTCSVHKFKA